MDKKQTIKTKKEMQNIIKRIVKKYQTKLDLKDWNLDVEVRWDVKTKIYFDKDTKNFLLVVNRNDFKNIDDLKEIIKNNLNKLPSL